VRVGVSLAIALATRGSRALAIPNESFATLGVVRGPLVPTSATRAEQPCLNHAASLPLVFASGSFRGGIVLGERCRFTKGGSAL